MLPGIAIYIFAVIIPLLYAAYISLFHWRGGTDISFVGLNNYLELLRDGEFWGAFKNNIIIVSLCIVGQLGISFILSMLFTSRMVKFKNIHRTAIFLPVVLAPIIVGMIWILVYNQNIGLIPTVLEKMGLGFMVLPWLDDPKLVIYAVSFPLIWQYVGLFLVIWLSGIQNISISVIESAEIDGAIGWKKARYIFLPLLKSTLLVNLMLSISGNMKVFDHIFVLTGGGPGTSSMVMAQYAYETSFNMFKLGYGSTQSIAMIILSLVIIVSIRLLVMRKKEV